MRIKKSTLAFLALFFCEILPAVSSDEVIKEIPLSNAPLSKSETLVVVRRKEAEAPNPKIKFTLGSGILINQTPIKTIYALLLRSGDAVTEVDRLAFVQEPSLSSAGPMFWFEDAAMRGNNIYYLYVINMHLRLGVATKNERGSFAMHYYAPFPAQYDRILNGYFTKDKDGQMIVALPIPDQGPRFQSPYDAFRISEFGVPTKVSP